jgi:predicted phosphodiesterase
MLIGIFSDAHGHVGGYDLAQSLLEKAGASSFYFLGDAIGYIPGTGVVKRLMSDRNVKVIMGNHEAMMLSGEKLEEKRAAVYQLEAVLAELKPIERAFLESLPTKLCMTHGGLRMLFVHGSPDDPTYGYVYPDTDLKPFRDVDADVVFMGNTHHPFVRMENGRLFVNVGSCGLPRDQDPRGCACLFDTERQEARMMRYSISSESRSLLATDGIAEPVAAYLRRYASFVEDI